MYNRAEGNLVCLPSKDVSVALLKAKGRRTEGKHAPGNDLDEVEVLHLSRQRCSLIPGGEQLGRMLQNVLCPQRLAKVLRCMAEPWLYGDLDRQAL